MIWYDMLIWWRVGKANQNACAVTSHHTRTLNFSKIYSRNYLHGDVSSDDQNQYKINKAKELKKKRQQTAKSY